MSVEINMLMHVKLGLLMRLLLSMHILEIWMTESFFSRNALTWLKLNHLIEKINSCLIHVYAHFPEALERIIYSPLREAGFEVRKITDALPCLLGWCAHDLKDFEDLTDL